MNDKTGILINQIDGNDSLLISFGGIKQGLGIPVFEFYKSLNNYKCDKIFVRDFKQMWYHGGVDSEIKNLEDLLQQLELLIHSKNYSRIYFLGNSMGGYAAILFGALLDVNKVLVFSPQSFIDKKSRILKFDRRWRKEIRQVYKNSQSTDMFDLNNVLSKANYSTSIEIHYSLNHRLDKIHSERLKNNKGVRLISYEEGGHGLVRRLKESGKLFSILKSTLDV